MTRNGKTAGKENHLKNQKLTALPAVSKKKFALSKAVLDLSTEN